MYIIFSGKYYIKLGHDSADYPKILRTATEVKHWYCSRGDKKMIEDIVTIIKDIVKGKKEGWGKRSDRFKDSNRAYVNL